MVGIHIFVSAANARIQLGRTRRVQINEFKGKQLIDIREFYEKDEQMLPGRKVSQPRGLGVCGSGEQLRHPAFLDRQAYKKLHGADFNRPRAFP